MKTILTLLATLLIATALTATALTATALSHTKPQAIPRAANNNILITNENRHHPIEKFIR
jgi:hypothetical protein